MNKRIPFRVIFITGQSNPLSWTLSPVQQDFLNDLGLSADEIYLLNFPYQDGSHQYSKINILLASYHNVKNYWQSRSKSFKQKYQQDVIRLVSEAQHTLFIAGSCGLELLNNLFLPQTCLNKLSIFAFGPVSRSYPNTNTLLVQGERDWISRFFFRSVDCRVPCSHMSYLNEPKVREACILCIADIRDSLNI